MNDVLNRLWQDDAGQDLTEYALVLVLIALAAISTMGSLANSITNVFKTAASDLAGRH